MESNATMTEPSKTASTDIEAVRALMADDMAAVNQLIVDSFRSEVALINQLSAYLIGSGGKRLRPLMLLISSRVFDYQGKHHHTLAAVIEFIHTATLLHDDVVDASDMRRGQATANNLWGNEASVLVGDFLYSRAFQMMVKVENLDVMKILSDTTNTIAEGEVLQLLNCHEPDISEEEYLIVIRSKTAKLFEAAAQLGAVLSGQDSAMEQALACYGRHLGTAFQLVDDVLDYSADSEELGKNVGDDLAEGKPTLPLIYAMKHGTKQQAAIIREAIKEGGREQIVAVTQIIEETQAIRYTAAAARKEAEFALQALEILPQNPYTRALSVLAEFSIQRSY